MDDPTKNCGPGKEVPCFCHEPVEWLQTGLAKPTGLTVDVNSQQVFFAEDDQSSGDTYWPLRAIDVDKKNKHNVIDKLLDPQGMDAQKGKVYYTEHHGQRVGVVDFDGKNQKVLHTFSGSDYPADVKVDVDAGKVFVTVGGALTTGQKLVSMDLDGSNFAVLHKDLIKTFGLTLVKETKEIYLVQGGHGGHIAKMNYQGQDMKQVLGGLEYPYMLAYDPDSKKLVFSEAGVGDGSLKITNLDGTDVKKSYTLGFAPMGVNFGEVPVASNASTY
jgi:DNA-binding beta-propeller fold protein YncE